MRTSKLLPLLLSWACAAEPAPEAATFPADTAVAQAAPQTEVPTDPGTDPVTTPSAHAEIGKRAIDFTLEAADGGFIRLADYEGQVIVIDLSGFT
jgi:hypothetical protein